MSQSKVLVVEDSQTEQFVLKELLLQFDFDCHIVGTGEEALKALDATEYSAILMDISLPGIDGIECTKRIRLRELGSGRRTPIIALTVQDQKSGRQAAMDAGMNDWISKPFDPEDLRKVLLRYTYDPEHPNLKTLPPLVAEEDIEKADTQS